MDLNEEQRLAVKNIVQAQNKPVPYLLFGPAGAYSLFDYFTLEIAKI